MKTDNLNDNFVEITAIDNPIEAALIKSSLEDSGIPFIIKEYHDSAYDGMFELTKGWGEILAPEKYKEYILNIINDLRSN